MSTTAVAQNRSAGLFLALAAAPAFGLSAILGKVALNDGAATLGLLAVRFAIATALFALLLVILKRAWPSRGPLVRLMVLGVIGQGGMAYFFFSALNHASAGLASLLLYLHPVLIVVGEVLLGWERLRPAKLVAIALAVIGCALTVGGGGGSALGIAYAIAAAFALTGYMLAIRRYGQDVDHYASSASLVLGATILFVVAALVFPPTLPQTATGWWAIIGLAVIATVVAYLLFIAALMRLPASDVATLMTIEPIFVVIVGALVLGEAVGWMQVAGGALILSSVVLVARQVRAH